MLELGHALNLVWFGRP